MLSNETRGDISELNLSSENFRAWIIYNFNGKILILILVKNFTYFFILRK